MKRRGNRSGCRPEHESGVAHEVEGQQTASCPVGTKRGHGARVHADPAAGRGTLCHSREGTCHDLGHRAIHRSTEAGRALAARLAGYVGRDGVVLGLPRGGVALTAEVADALHGTLDIVVVRKIGVPWQPERALGAVAAMAEDVETVRDERVFDQVQLDEETFGRPGNARSPNCAGGRPPPCRGYRPRH
jgi:hypothetical protein